MIDVKASIIQASELGWLSEVEDSGPRISQQCPLWVRHFSVRSGTVMPHPERHLYCEISLHLTGRGIEFVEREKAARQPGDLFIAGPGVPHWFKTTQYPLSGIAIYFLPSLLCELGPERDGLYILRRFTSRQGLQNRLVRFPVPLRRRMTDGFKKMHAEFKRKSLGREIRLRTLLMDILIDLVRWERQAGREIVEGDSSLKWQHVNRALHHLRTHFAEPVYALDVAKAAGVSESQLKILFKEALGMPWSRYIQGYRIQQAVALLGATDRNITEAALEVGFESLSHFNATFRSFMGTSPTGYLKTEKKTKGGSIPVIGRKDVRSSDRSSG